MLCLLSTPLTHNARPHMLQVQHIWSASCFACCHPLTHAYCNGLLSNSPSCVTCDPCIYTMPDHIQVLLQTLVTMVLCMPGRIFIARSMQGMFWWVAASLFCFVYNPRLLCYQPAHTHRQTLFFHPASGHCGISAALPVTATECAKVSVSDLTFCTNM